MKKSHLLVSICLAIISGSALSQDLPQDVIMGDGKIVQPLQVPLKASLEDYTYTYKGVKYTYISETNYTNYFDPNVHKPQDYGWYTDEDGWFVNAEKDYIVAASIDEESVPENGEVFILNDLVGYFTSHTHLGCIGDNAFTGQSRIKRIYFQDCDAQMFNSNTEFSFFIGHKAFANAPQLEKVDLMQYTTLGTNHWAPMPVYCCKHAWGTMLDGSPNAWIRVASSTLDEYRNSSVWTQHKERLISYEPSGYEINEYGVRYKCMLGQDGVTYLTNDGTLREEAMKQLRLWNADYQQFNATSLLASADNGATVYYTTVEGCDADYLKEHDGVARIYNDVGSYYNYKTLAIRRGAFSDCQDLKVVEFYQTNGRSENSYSDLKLVIENNAFRGCTNLKEIRMYYRVEDGDDHWETLGPKDVIPGDNIFGELTYDETVQAYESGKEIPWNAPKDVRIIVSPTLYQDFITDPNWARYFNQIVALEYEPTSWDKLTVDNVVYDYASKTINTLPTDQVVTQELSWWNVPIKVIEIVCAVKLFKSIKDLAKSIKDAYYAVDPKTLVSPDMADGIITKVGQEAAAKSNEMIGWGDLLQDNLEMGVKEITKYPVNDVLFRSKDFYPGLDTPLMKAGVVIVNSQKVSWGSNIYQILSNNPEIKKILITAIKENGVRWGKEYAKQAASFIPIWKNYINLRSSMIANTVKQGAQLLAPGIMNLAGSAYSNYMGTGGDMSDEQFQQGLAENIRANIHAVSNVCTFWTTPDKKLIYNVYVEKPSDPDIEDFTIYNDIGRVYNYRTVAIRKDAFRDNRKLRSIHFAESYAVAADAYLPMRLAIPDSAFAGCSQLTQFDLIYQTRLGGERGLGPENFILGGDSIFAGCDSTRLRIVIASDRLQDFLDSEQWSKYKRYFSTRDTEVPDGYLDYGVHYAFAYEMNTAQKITKMSGHKVEHLMAIGADNEFIIDHGGQMGLFNEIGIFNNYKLDYVRKDAFRGNSYLKNVSFWDLKGWLYNGDCYYQLDIDIQDSAFAYCSNLESVDLLYLCTDGINHANPMHPDQIRLGNGVFDHSDNVIFKMTAQQVPWFEADSAWAAYKERFMPCLVQPVDKAVCSALSGLSYTTLVGSPSTWTEIVDMSRLKEKGFDWLSNRFARNKDLRQFPEFKQFEWAGLDYIGGSWFVACENLTAIELPSTIKTIGGYAFQQCDLREIEIPASVTQIREYAFFDNRNLKTVRCLGAIPADIETQVFGIQIFDGLQIRIDVPDGFRIYVPAQAVESYKQKWSAYKDYIVPDNGQLTFPKKVTTTGVGQLARELGLELIMDGDYLKGLKGAYWNIDSLTVSGPLNGIDVGVLRFLGGADVNNSDPTNGRLRYLDLYNAQLKADDVHPYQCYGFNNYLEQDNVVGEYMFYYCERLETVILPKDATYISQHALDHATNLKQLAIGDKTVGYDDCITKDVTGLDELVFLTDSKAASDSWGFWCNYDSWLVDIDQTYTPKSQVGAYQGENALARYCNYISAAFDDEKAMRAFAQNGYYFPNSIFKMDNIDGILQSVPDVRSFNELRIFPIKDLGQSIAGCSQLQAITLPYDLTHIGADDLSGCISLDTIRVYCDSVPQMEPHALKHLPQTFRIYVPRTLVKRYQLAWAEYADHIVSIDNTYFEDIISVTTTEPNTLAQKLGLTVKTGWSFSVSSEVVVNKVTGLEGEYADIRKLKVTGPISGQDLAVIRHLAGYSPWIDARNPLGHLEYLDLYDAQLVSSDWRCAQDKYTTRTDRVDTDNVLPAYALLKCYQLKTLILPKTCVEIRSRSIMECEYLENVVIGDDTRIINWSAFDDDAALTRMYILSTTKPEMDADNFIWRNLCNNYNPTFDAFYVRPSLYNDYVRDEAYTGNSWQRTSNISTGDFNDDDTFLAFASHAIVTSDELANVTDIDGWFRERTGITDLTKLSLTMIDSLKAADIRPLTQLKRIALPSTLTDIESGTFARARQLRWADFQLCDSTDIIDSLKNGGLSQIGIGESTLCYMPKSYGSTDQVNIVVMNASGSGDCNVYRLIDTLDYDVPYSFNAVKVENTRLLAKSEIPYTVCLPYRMDIPVGAKAYKLSGRSYNELIFTQTFETLEALQPYLIWADEHDVSLDTQGRISIPASGGLTYGRQQNAPGYSMRGTLDGIDNTRASLLGAYILQNDGKWHPVQSDTDEHRSAGILPYRAYLLQSRWTRASAIGMLLEDVTGVEQLRTIDSDGTERIYDLGGRLMETPVNGVNIINGKKYYEYGNDK